MKNKYLKAKDGSRPENRPPRRSVRTCLLLASVALALIMILPPVKSPAANLSSTPIGLCSSVRNDTEPRYHHILMIDGSYSMVNNRDKVINSTKCYLEKYVIAGEDLTIGVFAYDKFGSARELGTLTVPPDGSLYSAGQLLDNIRTDNKKTKTYFAPVADFLSGFLRDRVRLNPVILTWSDGKSDGAEADFMEIPFESLGPQGVFTAPGVKKFKVAVAGGLGLDLSGLFTEPVTGKPGRSTMVSGAAVDPCLVTPGLLIEVSDPEIVLKPSMLNPDLRTGTVSFVARNNCAVSRFRIFDASIDIGGRSLQLVKGERTLLDNAGRSFSYPITWEGNLASGDAVVKVSIEAGDAAKTFYPAKSTPVRVQSWWSVYGTSIAAMMAALGLVVSGAFFGYRVRDDRLKNSPILLTAGGGSVVGLSTQNNSALIGGGGQVQLRIPGQEGEFRLARINLVDRKARRFIINPESDTISMEISGMTMVGQFEYHLGSPICCKTEQGDVCFSITEATAESVTFQSGVSGGDFIPPDNGSGVGGFDSPDFGAGASATYI